MKALLKVVLSLLITLAFMNGVALAEKATEKPRFTIEVKDKLIYLHAEKANFKDILKELENKAAIKTTVFDGVPDQEVTLDIKALPFYALDTLLEKMQIKNYAVFDDKGVMTAYVIPEGKNISEFIKGKTIIRPAHFATGKNINQIKGHEIVSITKGKDNISIRYVKDEILLRFHLGVTKEEIEGIMNYPAAS